MRTFCLSLFLACALSSVGYAAPSGKELAKEATRLQQLASQETDPTKSQELQRQACTAWSAAYDAGLRIEYQFALGLCKQELHDLEGAETALRLFLVQAPQNHRDRGLAQGALDQVVAERNKEKKQATPPALRLTEPIHTQETQAQWKRRTLFATGALGGLGLVAGAITFGALWAQREDLTRIPPTELEVQ